MDDGTAELSVSVVVLVGTGFDWFGVVFSIIN
jgi:hypothetical protein